MAPSLAERFWRRVTKSDDCWTWTGATTGAGYGHIKRVGGRSGTILAHRLSWEITSGPIPDGMSVLHRCDKPACVRPEHLFLGTQADNMRDMVAKRRGPTRTPVFHGTGHPLARLTEAAVLEIRRRSDCGEPRTTLARHFGINRRHVGAIALRRKWRHVPEQS